MEIGVLGGKGTAGSAAVAELERRGHVVRVLSRRTGFDAMQPEQAAEALRGLDAIVDCLQPTKTTAKASRALLVDGVRATAAAAAEVGVGHYVCLSIVGIDGLPFAYYRAKVEQEAVVLAAPLPATVVRATQFPELFDGAWNATRRLGVIPAPRGKVAPITPAQVAVVLADVVESGPGDEVRRQVRGDEVVDIRELARGWKRRAGSKRPVLPVPAVGGALKAVAAGGLVDEAAQPFSQVHHA